MLGETFSTKVSQDLSRGPVAMSLKLAQGCWVAELVERAVWGWWERSLPPPAPAQASHGASRVPFLLVSAVLHSQPRTLVPRDAPAVALTLTPV